MQALTYEKMFKEQKWHYNAFKILSQDLELHYENVLF